MASVQNELQQKKVALDSVGPKETNDILAALGKVQDATDHSAAPCPETAPASTGAQAENSESKPRAALNCPEKQMPANLNMPTFDNLLKLIVPADGKSTSCAMLALPGQRKIIAVNSSAGKGLAIQPEGQLEPMPIDIEDYFAMSAASNILTNAPFKVSAKDLLASYFPKGKIQAAGKISLPVDDKGKTEDIPSSMGWTSANGTKIRYAVVEAGGEPILVLGLQRQGDKELVLPIKLPKQPH
jgi:hypothetical protein